MNKRVTGLGGFFFKAKDPDKIKEWYGKHLGIPVDAYGWTFKWHEDKEGQGITQWSPFSDTTTYFQPSEKQFMINFRVKNLYELLKVLEEEGVTIVGQVEEYDYGKFGWILDPEGNKIELWEPVDNAFL